MSQPDKVGGEVKMSIMVDSGCNTPWIIQSNQKISEAVLEIIFTQH